MPRAQLGHSSYAGCLFLTDEVDLIRAIIIEFRLRLARWSGYREAARRAGGGFVNHDLFWNVLSPWGGHPPGPESDTIQERHLASAIDRSFGSFAEMQYAFSNAASVFSGSG